MSFRFLLPSETAERMRWPSLFEGVDPTLEEWIINQCDVGRGFSKPFSSQVTETAFGILDFSLQWK
ncbi:hypothetical protein IGI04_008009 [Brassica rapa subsp. trilocularis]|uniref:Uncharacterized protein n=1 Tax=Brassica rapa subsp. trilocularis TaxID=1813537 RepID=A0ABQ7NLK8_BRACM|nr:hypothetical protein IGI04_008009 [Brassica rapa subsp. trilocularis]